MSVEDVGSSFGGSVTTQTLTYSADSDQAVAVGLVG
jgi:hypothetical protein